MEQLLARSRRMGYAQPNKKQPAVPKEQMKVVIITPSVRIPRSIFRCEIDSDGRSIYQDKPDVDDMDDVEFLNRRPEYRPRKSWTPPGYGDDD